jgi:predicted transcriptional regulator
MSSDPQKERSTISCHIPKDLVTFLDEYAKMRHLNRSNVIRKSIFEYLKGFMSGEEKEKILDELEDIDKCSSCGKEIESNWKFCPYCGNSLEE